MSLLFKLFIDISWKRERAVELLAAMSDMIVHVMLSHLFAYYLDEVSQDKSIARTPQAEPSLKTFW